MSPIVVKRSIEVQSWIWGHSSDDFGSYFNQLLFTDQVINFAEGDSEL